MNLFENYKGIYIAPEALEIAHEHEASITLEGDNLKDLKAIPGKPDSQESYSLIEQDGITVYVSKQLDQQHFNINIIPKQWWKPGKLEVNIDKENFPHPRL